MEFRNILHDIRGASTQCNNILNSVQGEIECFHNITVIEELDRIQ